MALIKSIIAGIAIIIVIDSAPIIIIIIVFVVVIVSFRFLSFSFVVVIANSSSGIDVHCLSLGGGDEGAEGTAGGRGRGGVVGCPSKDFLRG